MFQYNPLLCWPSAEDLPDSDDTPVDNQLQHLIPGLLELILAMVWAERRDWFFGVDMGIYYHPEIPAIVPDGFLSIGVERVLDEGLRLSYVLWEEHKVPILALEVVSQQRRGEWLYWYNQAGERLLTPEERVSEAEQIAQVERQRAETERQRAERLVERLRALGIDPESLD